LVVENVNSISTSLGFSELGYACSVSPLVFDESSGFLDKFTRNNCFSLFLR
jgi:hypothetical protein